MPIDLWRYRRYATLRVADSFLVRIHPFLQTLTFVIPVVATIVFWKAVFGEGGGTIGGYDLGDTILYLIIIKLIEELTWAYPGHMQHEIRFGELTPLLLLPASYPKIRYMEHIGNMITRWMNAILLMLIVFLGFHSDVRLPTTLWVYPAGVLSVAITFHLCFLLTLCVAFLSFWMEGHPPLLGHIEKLFGGYVVPLTFLPTPLQQVADLLPFKYMFYFPTAVLLGKTSPEAFVVGTALQLGWTFVLSCAARVLWKKGVRRYVAYGG
jgi:ABC-2 type transport system permease protein